MTREGIGNHTWRYKEGESYEELQDELKRLTDSLEQKDANIRRMAEHVLAAKQALIEKDSEEAYHQLYALAEYRAKTPLEPWAGLEKLLLDGEST